MWQLKKSLYGPAIDLPTFRRTGSRFVQIEDNHDLFYREFLSLYIFKQSCLEKAPNTLYYFSSYIVGRSQCSREVKQCLLCPIARHWLLVKNLEND